MKSRLFSLFYKLAKIQTAIDAEQQRKKPDWMRLLRLKRLRLMMKESLSRLSVPADWMTARMPAPVLVHAFHGDRAARRRHYRPVMR